MTASLADAGYPANTYGLFPDTSGASATSTPTETSKIPTVSSAIQTAGTLWHKDNPMLAVGIILAITIGAASVSGSARLGKSKASLELGDQK
ncbi:MAG TPA: hypothetical protein VGL75_01225 [Acidothermaceae bacterium]|jgi:hypothetical protein